MKQNKNSLIECLKMANREKDVILGLLLAETCQQKELLRKCKLYIAQVCVDDGHTDLCSSDLILLDEVEQATENKN